MMQSNSRIYVAGHRGLVGSALLRGLERRGYTSLLVRTHAELDLTDKVAVQTFFEAERPDYVLMAAAKVGGILANNTYPAEFLRENLEIQTNVIEASREFEIKRLLFLGSSCIYPKNCPQPIKEEYLLTGPLEPTNRPYALAKIAGVEMCWSYNRQYGTRFLAVMPTNLYGPGDNFDLTTSHVLPALLRKAYAAKLAGEAVLMVWGSGLPLREFLHADDLADACVYLMESRDEIFDSLTRPEQAPLVNIGTGEDIAIRDLAHLIAEIVGFAGELQFDTSKPDGTFRKLMDVSIMRRLGWHHRISLPEGIRRTLDEVKREVFQTAVADGPKS